MTVHITEVCVGWPGECSAWGGKFHGCVLPAGHPGRHRCGCGITRSGHRLPTRKRAAKCGEPGGYHAHRRRGEEACQMCKEAHSRYQQTRPGRLRSRGLR